MQSCVVIPSHSVSQGRDSDVLVFHMQPFTGAFPPHIPADLQLFCEEIHVKSAISHMEKPS